jgi:hypothetical protein
LLSNGVTTTAEMFVEEKLIQDMQELDQEGKLRVRVSLYPVHVDKCGDEGEVGEAWGARFENRDSIFVEGATWMDELHPSRPLLFNFQQMKRSSIVQSNHHYCFGKRV